MTETRAETFHRLKAMLLDPVGDDIPLPSIVGAIEFRREQYGLGASEWAVLLGMARSHYWEFVKGKRWFPRSAAVRAFKLGVPAEVLLQESGPIVVADIKTRLRNASKMSPEELRIYNREAKRRSRDRGVK